MVVALGKVDIKGTVLRYFVRLFSFFKRRRRDCHDVC